MGDLFVKKYNEANDMQTKDDLNIFDECSFSYLDILKEKEVEVYSKVETSCNCKSSVNYNTYYEKCSKCNGKGKIILNSNEVICNHCKGSGSLVKVQCPLCENTGKVIKRGKVRVKLNKELKDNDVIVLSNMGKESNGVKGDLYIKVKIKDLNYFEIKGNDVYDKRMIHFSKEDLSKGVSKRVETIKGFINVKSSASSVNEVVKLENEGINGGDFYICLENELVEIRGKDVFKNIIIDKEEKAIYFDYDSLSDGKKFLKTSYYKRVSEDKEYVELTNLNNFKIIKVKEKGLYGKNGGSRGDLYLRVFFSDEFKDIDDNLYHNFIKLNKYEIMDGKKVLEFNKSKIMLNFEKNMKDIKEISVKDYGYMINNKEFDDLHVMLNPYNYEIYSVSVRAKGKEFYINDYKKYFFEEIKVSNEGLKVSLSKKNDNIIVFDEEGNKVIIRIIRQEVQK